jgi:type II secretory pathway component PulM
MKERQKTDLRRISEQLEAHRDRLQGMGLLLYSQFVFMETNDPTEETIESLRAIITDRIERETAIIAALVSELDTMAEGGADLTAGHADQEGEGDTPAEENTTC